jgi:hypothetical protein
VGKEESDKPRFGGYRNWMNGNDTEKLLGSRENILG